MYFSIILRIFLTFAIVPADAIESCENGGTLIDFGRRCTCALRFRGERCEIDIFNPHFLQFHCNQRGEMKNDTCVCQQGFQGDQCQFPICQRGTLDGTSCHCSDGFHGLRCQLHDCGGGWWNEDLAQCQCHEKWWEGERCEKPKCQNGDQKKREDGAYFCDCSSSWEGLLCQTSKCRQGTMNSIGTQCICHEKFSGEWCDIPDCGEHGRPYSFGLCNCDPDWMGLHCDMCYIGKTGEYCNETEKPWSSWDNWSSWSHSSYDNDNDNDNDNDSSYKSKKGLEPWHIILIVVVVIVAFAAIICAQVKKRGGCSTPPASRTPYTPGRTDHIDNILPPATDHIRMNRSDAHSMPYPPPAPRPSHYPAPSAPAPDRQISSPPDYKDVEMVPPSYEEAVALAD